MSELRQDLPTAGVPTGRWCVWLVLKAWSVHNAFAKSCSALRSELLEFLNCLRVSQTMKMWSSSSSWSASISSQIGQLWKLMQRLNAQRSEQALQSKQNLLLRILYSGML